MCERSPKLSISYHLSKKKKVKYYNLQWKKCMNIFFRQPLLHQSSVSHDPSEVIQMLMLVLSYYYYQCRKQLCCFFYRFIQDSLLNRKFKRTFIWTRNILLDYRPSHFYVTSTSTYLLILFNWLKHLNGTVLNFYWLGFTDTDFYFETKPGHVYMFVLNGKCIWKMNCMNCYLKYLNRYSTV